MSAPKGNQFWLARSRHGPNFKYDEDTLWEAACEYFQWVENNPLWEDKSTISQGGVIANSVAKMRPYTLSGLYVFIDICKDTWLNYRQRQDLLSVTKKIDEIIYNQKFSGASAGLLNANIIARDLGLTEKTETKLDATIGLTELTDEELERRRQQLEQEYEQSERT